MINTSMKMWVKNCCQCCYSEKTEQEREVQMTAEYDIKKKGCMMLMNDAKYFSKVLKNDTCLTF